MRKELNIAQTPSPTNDHSLLSHGHHSLVDRLEIEMRDILGDYDAEEFVNIPVVLPIFGAKLPHNTVQIKISRNSPCTYGELIEKILFASEGLFRILFEGDDNKLAAALRHMERLMSTSSCIYFVWDFAPQIHFTKTCYTMPEYGTSEASHLGSEEFVEHLRAARTGRISYVFVAIELTRDKVTDPGSKELKQSQQEKKEGKGPDDKPATVSEKGNISTTPLQQPPPLLPMQKGQIIGGPQKLAVGANSKPQELLSKELSGERGKSTTPQKQPLPKQVSQTDGSQLGTVNIGRQESAMTGNITQPGLHGGCYDTEVRASGSNRTGYSNFMDKKHDEGDGWMAFASRLIVTWVFLYAIISFIVDLIL